MNYKEDFAILILDESIGIETGFIGITIWTSMLKIPPCKYIGFSNDFSQCYEKENNLFNNFPFLIETELDHIQGFTRYIADSQPGQSGSALFFKDPNTLQLRILGLHLGIIKNPYNEQNMLSQYLNSEKNKAII